MLNGVLVALVTPFKDGQVDEEALRELIEFQIENGVSGLVPCGTTGESATLSHDEHKRVIEITVDAAKKRVPVVAGAGSNNTAEAIDLTRFAKDVGADAALHITPYYNKPTQEGIFRHFQAICQKAPLPIVVYNIQGRTGINITPETMARITELPEVVAIKEASGSLGQMASMVNLCGDNAALFAGDDGLTLPVLAIGGKGVISVLANLLPKEMSQLVKAWQDGNVAEAQKRANELTPLCNAMFIETNPIPVKTAVAMAGIIPNSDMRLPLCEMQPANKEKLVKILKDHSIIS